MYVLNSPSFQYFWNFVSIYGQNTDKSVYLEALPVTAVSDVPGEEGESTRIRELTIILIAILVPTFPDLFADNKLTIIRQVACKGTSTWPKILCRAP